MTPLAWQDIPVNNPVRQHTLEQIDPTMSRLAASLGYTINDPGQRLRFTQTLMVWVEDASNSARRQLAADPDYDPLHGQPF